MASGVIVGSTNISGLGARLKWRSTPDRTNNTSTLTLILELNNNSGQTWQMSGSWDFSVDGGQPYTRSDTVTLPSGSGWVEAVGKGGIVVQHGSNGAKTVTLSVSGGWQGMTTAISGSAALDTITPAVQPCTITGISPAEIHFGSQATISFTRPSGSAYAALWMSLRTANETVNLDGSGSSYTWTLPSGWRSVMQGDTREWATAALITYEDAGHTIEAGRSEMIWYALADASPPSPGTGWLTIYPTYPSGITVPSGWDSAIYPGSASPGVMLSGVCGLRAVVNSNAITLASGDYIDWSASALVVGGTRYLFNTTGTVGVRDARSGMITASGTVSVAVSLVTAGGGRYTASVDLDVIAYTAPSLNSPGAFRSNSSGDARDAGGYIHATSGVLHTAIMREVGGVDTDINPVSLKVRWKLSSADWPLSDTWVDLTAGSAGDVYPVPTGSENPLSSSSTYDFQIRAKDQLRSTIWNALIPSEAVFLHALDGNAGVGIGHKTSRTGYIDSAWSIHTDHDVDVQEDLTVHGSLILTGGLQGLEIRTGTITLIGGSTRSVSWTTPQTPMTGLPVVLIAHCEVDLRSVTPTYDALTDEYTGFEVLCGNGSSETVPYIAIYWGGSQ